MTDGLEVKGLDQLRDLSLALKETSDKDITNRVRSAIRAEIHPAGLRVLRAGAQPMPQGGGLAHRIVSQGRVGMTSALVSRDLHVTMTLSNTAVNMRSLDAGVVMHPDFGNRSEWERQSVPSRTFTRAFEAEAARLRTSALRGAQQALDDVGRKVSRHG